MGAAWAGAAAPVDGEDAGEARRSNADRGEDGGGDVVRCVNVHKTYLLGIEGVAALRGVSLRIARGEFLMLYGTSGGGKSTLLNLIGTIDLPTKGTVEICGTRVSERTPHKELAKVRLKRLGFVFQTFNLIENLTAVENVELPLTLNGELTPKERRERCEALLGAVGMGERLGHLPAQLSGGERQRVTIARALANWPDVLLLDEPTGDLDTANTDVVMRILVDLNRNHGITLVMVSHDSALAALADRVVYMRDGRIGREERIATARREAATAQLFAEGLGALDSVSGQREGAGAEGAHDAGALARRGLEARQCSITQVRAPSAYATFAAQIAAAPAGGSGA
jgi:putative ABC transport system ATP-binding protein